MFLKKFVVLCGMGNSKKYISLLSDYGFKTVFADQTDTLFLRKAIQALIQSENEIKRIEFLRNEFTGETKEMRGGLYDLFCRDEMGNEFIVEMQWSGYRFFIQRAKFYAFQRLNTLVRKGAYHYDDLPMIYCISLLGKAIFPKSELFYHFGTLKNQQGELLDNQITHIIVEIDKFEKKSSEVYSDLEKLLYIMKYSEEIEAIMELPDFLKEEWIDRALEKMDTSKMTPDQYSFYQITRAKNASITRILEEERRQAIKDAVEKAVEKAVEETIESQAIQTAKTLKERGIEHQIIAESTGLELEIIEKL